MTFSLLLNMKIMLKIVDEFEPNSDREKNGDNSDANDILEQLGNIRIGKILSLQKDIML